MQSNFGGFKWNRTTDAQIFSLSLYQLSYEAVFVWSKLKFVRQFAIGRFINKVTNFDAIKLGGRCEIRTHGPFLIDDFQGRCIKPLCQSSVLWWNVLDSNQLTHYRSRFYRPLQSPMLLTFHCGLRERIRTFDPLIPNQALCQTELLGESFQIQHKIIIHHITSYVKFLFTSFCVVPEAGVEPARPKSRGFKPLASTNFAIRAAICISFQIQHKIIIHHITSYVKFLFTTFCFIVTGRIYEAFMY